MSCGKKWKFKKWQVPRIPNYTYWTDLRHIYWDYVDTHKMTNERQQELWDNIIKPKEKACNEKVDKIFAATGRHGLNGEAYYSYRIKDLDRELAGKEVDDLIKETLRKCGL